MEATGKPLYTDFLKVPVVLVGAGGIGSNILELLVKCGTKDITIWDPDTLKPVNLAQQSFDARDVGEVKSHLLAQKALRIHPSVRVRARTLFRPGSRLDGIVISGVHSMKSRRVVFAEACRQKERVALFIDGRLSRSSNEWVELYFIDPKRDDEVEFYREWLYTDNEVGPPGPRPTKLSAHTPIMLAGLLGTSFARWVNEGRHPLKVTFDGTAFTLVVYWPDETLRRSE